MRLISHRKAHTISLLKDIQSHAKDRDPTRNDQVFSHLELPAQLFT